MRLCGFKGSFLGSFIEVIGSCMRKSGLPESALKLVIFVTFCLKQLSRSESSSIVCKLIAYKIELEDISQGVLGFWGFGVLG